MKALLPMVLFLALSECSSSKINENLLLGKWMMVSVYDGINDVTEKHNPSQNRWIQFRSDHQFESGGEPFGRNTGKWSMDKYNILYLDSDAGEGDDSFWSVNIKNDQMIWKGANSSFTERFQLTHRRASTP